MYKLFAVLLLACSLTRSDAHPYLVILGTAQDGGYPHAGCKKECCTRAWANDSLKRYVVSFALVDSVTKEWWLFEATPDIKEQLQYFKKITAGKYGYLPQGIFITHAHIGHYTGLMQLGREVMGAKEVPVYTLPRMAQYLRTNGPWSQLATLKNIVLQELKEDSSKILNERISITAFRVPHRDEYSETAGFRIATSGKKYLFIPDVDKWEKWNRSIVEEVKAVDIALLDATFNAASELPGRAMTEVPHPFVPETIHSFYDQPDTIKQRVYFIHFNHTNELLWQEKAREQFHHSFPQFHLAEQGATL